MSLPTIDENNVSGHNRAHCSLHAGCFNWAALMCSKQWFRTTNVVKEEYRTATDIHTVRTTRRCHHDFDPGLWLHSNL